MTVGGGDGEGCEEVTPQWAGCLNVCMCAHVCVCVSAGSCSSPGFPHFRFVGV